MSYKHEEIEEELIAVYTRKSKYTGKGESIANHPSFAVVDTKNINFFLISYRFNFVKYSAFFCCVLLCIVL